MEQNKVVEYGGIGLGIGLLLIVVCTYPAIVFAYYCPEVGFFFVSVLRAIANAFIDNKFGPLDSIDDPDAIMAYRIVAWMFGIMILGLIGKWAEYSKVVAIVLLLIFIITLPTAWHFLKIWEGW